MDIHDRFLTVRKAPPGQRKLSRDTVFMIGDLLPLCDFIAVLIAAWLATLAYGGWLPAGAASALWDDAGRAALVAAMLAPLILCDRAFVSFASTGQTAALIRCYAVRFVMFAGAVATLGFAGRSLGNLPTAWLMLWLASSLLVTAIIRLLLVANLRRLERNGVLTEKIAVVGAGPIADRLIDHLQRTRRGSVDIVGIFDDRADRGDRCAHKATGSIDDLVELGKSQPMDWILIALPATAHLRVAELTRSIVHRLKSLSVPIGLCPEIALAPRKIAGWDSIIAAAQTVVPRWIITLLGLPLATLRALSGKPQKMALCLDDYELDAFADVAARFGQRKFGYVVTPNADHLIRLHRQPSFRALYAGAAYVLLDSRFIAHVLRLTRKLLLPVCAGSDLTAKLFTDVIRPADRLVLIGGSDAQAASLRQRYGLEHLDHFNPPMGFINDPAAVEDCLRFVEAHSPFRYCLLTVGAPQQEIVAQRLKERGIARGLALCIGASINFLTGGEQRAPQWMQRAGIEWLFRLLQAPRRMARRYLVQGPRLFGLLRKTRIVVRAAAVTLPRSAPGVMTAPRRAARVSYARRATSPRPALRRGSATAH